MTNCTSTLISKLTETIDYILGTCMPKLHLEDEESFEASRGPKDDNYRKEELKQLVVMFASRAQNYIDCVRLSLEDSKRYQSFYRLDNMLEKFIIKTNEVVEEIPIHNIKSVLNFDQIQSPEYHELTKSKLISELSLNEKNRLVLLEYLDSSGKDGKLTILVEEVGNSDPFITVVRILKMYANDKKNNN
ncbi:hypothetical protein TpMuguga_01g00596 [Theileria parva strain Muguga]|uniref:Uncharacterized protein n=1 Tax=Theileria parva TaxID=5875 RepID=Q4N874_THEPA|nr:uncharacterized protein TpMuguga_01g00596 [Theileria parva strain Muguga]EAN33834.1 hypothetical protein TpMuguga_01g00596 [Theileria parva strain Muguga]|eukprot:XP_766117.1 hypothetical protein [Theileria parva strain Muguga]